MGGWENDSDIVQCEIEENIENVDEALQHRQPKQYAERKSMDTDNESEEVRDAMQEHV
jgi:hypothetical protein